MRILIYKIQSLIKLRLLCSKNNQLYMDKNQMSNHTLSLFFVMLYYSNTIK